jgi:hypothetical protein
MATLCARRRSCIDGDVFGDALRSATELHRDGDALRSATELHRDGDALRSATLCVRRRSCIDGDDYAIADPKFGEDRG